MNMVNFDMLYVTSLALEVRYPNIVKERFEWNYNVLIPYRKDLKVTSEKAFNYRFEMM